MLSQSPVIAEASVRNTDQKSQESLGCSLQQKTSLKQTKNDQRVYDKGCLIDQWSSQEKGQSEAMNKAMQSCQMGSFRAAHGTTAPLVSRSLGNLRGLRASCYITSCYSTYYSFDGTSLGIGNGSFKRLCRSQVECKCCLEPHPIPPQAPH